MPVKTPHALLAALLVLSALALAACGPDPSEIDRSPVAGMTGENPTPGVIEGEAIEGRQPNRGRITLTGDLSADGAAAVECAPVEGAAAGHGESAHAEPGDAEAGHGDMEHGDINQGEAEPAAMEHGDADHGGAEDTGTAHHGGQSGLRVAFEPNDLPGTRITVAVEGYHGDGTYEAAVSVETQSDDGAYRVSHGTGSATLENGTLLATDAATHWVAGSVSGGFEGGAGAGELDGSFTRCFYFE